MKKYLLTLGLIAATALGVATLRAQDTNAAATNAAAAGTNAPAAVVSTNAPTAASTNAPTMEQRLESVEAYFANTDPTATYKDTNGNWTVNFGLGASLINSQGNYVSYPGAGHNAWLLASTALVLFMTLPGLALFYGGLVRKKNILSV